MENENNPEVQTVDPTPEVAAPVEATPEATVEEVAAAAV